MIIRLIKQVKIKDVAEGREWYHVTINDQHVDDTFTQDFDKAKKMFAAIVARGGKSTVVQVIDEVEINEGYYE